MKRLLILFTLLTSIGIFAQSKYLTKTGKVTFEASVPSFEEVKATNKNTTAIINTENGEFAALVLVKGFRFKNALMEEHFNENYAESDDYPKATFKGTIANFSMDELSASNIKSYSGSITFHGKTKTLDNESLNIKKQTDGSLLIKGELKLNVADFDIEIPKIVSNKLSSEVNVSYEFVLNKK
ncbi:YceI-like domain-containing protein [Winogradskyella wandonensis]|uniref:YceI-like domain-containing protein n=1 Tax=Winogradskyella wandonensis TaxID=1442586 RepID=A0A4R1KX87_9FLAO|nr:YceI family protein [Winogradskyella wandonensis]TCK68929.1 YceI-like domain-containing protein [Winogradskyella wandonensis]